MKTTLHAPAPWAINRISRWHDGTPKDFDYLEVNSLEGYRVAFAWDCKPKSFATMNLITAAPELLSTLEKLLSRAEKLDQSATHEGLQNCEAIAKAREAIRKAKGEK
jgi:hypothetical protein